VYNSHWQNRRLRSAKRAMQPIKYLTTSGQLRPTGARPLIRHLALSGLAALFEVTGRMSPSADERCVQFLVLHSVFEDEEESFRRLLRALSKEYSFVGYSTAVSKVLSGRIDGRYLAISFDDGFKNFLCAARIMAEFGITACFFLCGSMIGETEYRRINESGGQRLDRPPIEFLDWEDVEALVEQGHEIGGHTLNHCNLIEASGSQLQDEIAGSFELLQRRVGSVKHFAWPYGRFFHFSASAAKVVFDTGFVSCASGERGCHTNREAIDKRMLCLRRDHLIPTWPLPHIRYFLAKSRRSAPRETGLWPQGWSNTITSDTTEA
jgi:peptidoglycan/xylan/chitin deacetylase (PgdA/CDA1 family)